MAIIKNPFMVVGDKNPLIAASEEELNALLMSKNTGKAVSYNGNMYVIEETEPDKPAATILYKPEVLGVPLSADTEEKANALLVENKVGSIFKYTGEGGGAATVNPTAVGDTVTQIFFDTTKSAEEIYAEMQKLPFDESGMFVFFAEAMESGKYVAAGKMPLEEGKFIYIIGNGGMEGDALLFVYSEDYTPTEADIGITEWGWQNTSPLANLDTFIITQMNGKDIWGSWLSATNEFASGSASAYEKDKLYLIEAGGTENPTAIGNTVTEVYFDTTKSAEEVYADMQKLPYDENGAVLLFAEAMETGKYAAAMKMEMDTGKFVYMIANGGFGPEYLLFAYSTDLTPAEADMGITEWGWQNTSPLANLDTFIITQMNGKDIWGSWLSATNEFASSGGTPKTKPLYVAAGSLNITENGAFNVEGKEEVIVNVLSGNIDALIEGRITSIESGATQLKDYAFYGCEDLTSVNFTRALDMGYKAFGECKNLERADFAQITNIASAAFTDCEKLTTLILRTTSQVATLQSQAFYGTPIENGTGYVYVPDDLVESYKTATETDWSTYAAQIKGLSELAE